MNASVRPQRLLLFGGTGAIGSAIAARFAAESWNVVVATRGAPRSEEQSRWDPLTQPQAPAEVAAKGPFDAVCWAQGANRNDSVYDVDLDAHLDLYRANCLFIVAALRALLDGGLLARPARLCVISSIWQDIARQSKLSYGMTKAALRGLVLSAANDLARDGHLVNAVLPGALDTPMTHANLSPTQLGRLVAGTQFGHLAGLGDVASTVHFLCSAANTGVTGQFIKVDLGYSDVRIV